MSYCAYLVKFPALTKNCICGGNSIYVDIFACLRNAICEIKMWLLSLVVVNSIWSLSKVLRRQISNRKRVKSNQHFEKQLLCWTKCEKTLKKSSFSSFLPVCFGQITLNLFISSCFREERNCICCWLTYVNTKWGGKKWCKRIMITEQMRGRIW